MLKLIFLLIENTQQEETGGLRIPQPQIKSETEVLSASISANKPLFKDARTVSCGFMETLHKYKRRDTCGN
jgi:hypothetical protein